MAHKAREDPVGPNWLRRMGWELRRVPQLLREVRSTSAPETVPEFSAEHVLALRATMAWEKSTFALHFAALRQFLRWAGNPVERTKALWRLPSGQPGHRRWLTQPQLERLFVAADRRGRILVALEGFNGLRRVEVLRLRCRDVLPDEASLRVLGKGRDGGKWRKIPMHPVVQRLLRSVPGGDEPEARVLPLSSSGADRLLQRSARRAGFLREGIRVSHHDLRRTFGRLAHRSGMDLVQLKNLFGHTSMDMTVHYIGVDADEMRAGLHRMRLNLDLPPPSDAGFPTSEPPGRAAARDSAGGQSRPRPEDRPPRRDRRAS